MLEGISERAMVIALQNADMELNHLKSLLQTKMKHSYLEKYIQKPVINEEKLFELHTILNNLNIRVKKKEKYMIKKMIAEIELNNLKSLLKMKMKHSYLEKYIQKPVINEEKLFVLHAILNNINMPVKKKEKYMITTMLVQIALDTHDLVTDKKNDTVEPL